MKYLDSDVSNSIDRIDNVIGHIRNNKLLTDNIVDSLRKDLVTVIHFFETKLQLIESIIVQSLKESQKNGD